MVDERGIKRFYPLVSGVALGLAAFLFWRGANAAIRQMPDTPESADPFYCTACEHVTEMTPRKRAKWIGAKGIVVTRGDPDAEQQTGHRIPRFACPECEQMTLKVASKCFDCNKVFGGQTCPTCPAAPGPSQESAKRPQKKSPRPNRR